MSTVAHDHQKTASPASASTHDYASQAGCVGTRRVWAVCGWLAACAGGWLAGFHSQANKQLVGWLAGWLRAGWLAGWLAAGWRAQGCY